MKINISYNWEYVLYENDKFHRLKRKANDAVIERVGEKSTILKLIRKRQL